MIYLNSKTGNSFWGKMISLTYLGYVIIQDGIKFDLNKLKGIMDLIITTTTTEALLILGMEK